MDANQIIIKDFIANHPFAAVQALEQFDAIEVAGFFQKLSSDATLKIFGLMSSKKVADCFLLMPVKKTADLIEIGDPYVIASFLKHLEQPKIDAFLANASSQKRAIIELKMKYIPNSVGALMQPAISVHIDMSVGEAIQVIQNSVQKDEFYLYVVDTEGAYKGIVRPKELMIADNNETLENLMITTVSKIYPDVQIKTIMTHSAWFDYHHIPVINKSEKLLGTLPYKSTIDVTQESSDTLDAEIKETGGALGELYSIGLTGLLKSLGK